MKTIKPASVLIACMLLASFSLEADAQNKFRLPFGKSRKTENTRLELQQTDGPWLIMCASFVGDEGEHQAKNLVRELRQKHNLNAFIYRHRFEFGNQLQGIGWEVVDSGGQKDIRPKRMKPAGESEIEEIAVLVGNFSNVEDSRAQKTLHQIKMLHPSSLANFDPNRGSSQQLRVYREVVRRVSTDAEDKLKGPLSAAFLLPNPMLPNEYFEANKVDQFVMKLNRNVKFSLLDNPSTYSVRVATFRGDSTFKLNEIEEKERELNFLKRLGRPGQESKLNQAAANAHLLTEELRKRGVEAYEFHDRHESYVCVGGYDWISKKNGRSDVNNPQIVKVINTFKATVENLPNHPGAICPQQLNVFKKSKKHKDIVFDAQPVPVLVPKAHVSTSSRFRMFK